jgi:hypothetical protein
MRADVSAARLGGLSSWAAALGSVRAGIAFGTPVPSMSLGGFDRLPAALYELYAARFQGVVRQRLTVLEHLPVDDLEDFMPANLLRVVPLTSHGSGLPSEISYVFV